MKIRNFHFLYGIVAFAVGALLACLVDYARTLKFLKTLVSPLPTLRR